MMHNGIPAGRAGVIVVLALGGLLNGCAENGAQLQPKPPEDRTRQLMVLAAEEARDIDDMRQRLSRLLNVAHRQIEARRPLDARTTLGHVRAALVGGDAGHLETAGRLAGWVSISELARRAEKKRFAASACRQAATVLRKVKPAVGRCAYVRSLAAETRKAVGNDTAAALLREASQWVAESSDAAWRREMYVAIASDLFGCGDYVGGRNVLRCENDPTWRSQVLERLSKNPAAARYSDQDLTFKTHYYVADEPRATTTAPAQ